jgi:hypothetical protein
MRTSSECRGEQAVPSSDHSLLTLLLVMRSGSTEWIRKGLDDGMERRGRDDTRTPLHRWHRARSASSG